MNSTEKSDHEKPQAALSSMMQKTTTAMAYFKPGTSQHTLLKNRLEALEIALWLITVAPPADPVTPRYTSDDLKKALAPIASLIHKSEKAQQKVAPGTWQHTMLEENLRALRRALPLLKDALNKQ